MLGFSQYSQVSYVAIIEQKIRVFLLAIFTVSPRLVGLVSTNSEAPIQSAANDLLFNLFVQSLKDKNIYEEYLLPSVFINDINYDYITNEDSRTFETAEKNLKNAFFRVLKEVVGDGQPDPQNNEKPLSSFLSILIATGKIRRIPEYKDDTFLKIPKNFLVEIGTPVTSLFDGDSLKDGNVFYLETFYRLRDDVAASLFKNQILEAQFLSKSEALTYVKENKLKGTISDNFIRGIRLMMNLTSLIEFTASSIPGISALGNNINLPAYNKETLQKLPFLDKEFLETLANVVVFAKNNRNYFDIQPFGTNQPSATVNKIREDVRLAFDTVKNKTNNKKSFSSSKSLVCVEDLGGDSSFVYFPVSMSEFISEKFDPSDSELAHGLAATTTYNEFFVTKNFTELIATLKILIKFTTINAVDFFDAADNSAIKSQNEALDNMITNLINFDEVSN